MNNKLLQLLEEKVLILDGAMGTMLQQYKFTEEDFRGDRFKDFSHPLIGNNDLLSITQPQAVTDIHRKYLAAGADIIETNTFSSTSVGMADYHMEELVYEINFQSAKMARAAADEFTLITPDKPRFVAGSIGPTNRTAGISPDVNNPGFRAITFDELKDAYRQQVDALLDGGVDILLVETVFDTLNAKAALFAIEQAKKARKLSGQPGVDAQVMLSGTITDASGRTLSGQTVEAFLISVSNFPLLSIGLNCAFGPDQLKQYIRRLSGATALRISAHPNAGLPNEFGDYDQSALIMSKHIKEYLDEGLLNIVGGCCGTTPEHIKVLNELAKNYIPRKAPVTEKMLKLSGLEPLIVSSVTNFVNVGERTNVAGSKMFLNLIKEENYTQAVAIARDQVEGGAQIIDINMDDAMIDGVKAMTEFINMIASEPDIARIPVMVDSSKWEIIEAALKVLQGKGIVNSISLKEGEAAFVEKASKILQYGAAVIVMAFDEIGQADTLQRRIDICKRSYDILVQKVGFPPEDIIFDPNIFPVATGMEEHKRNGVDFFEVTKWIKKNLPYAGVSGGVSNVSFSFRGNNRVREAMHSSFLFHAIKNGMTMGIVNPQMLVVYDDIDKELLEYVEDVLLNRRSDATERLVSFAESFTGNNKKSEINILAWRGESLQDRITHALVRGVEEYIQNDIEEARHISHNPVDVIEIFLMNGMNVVGDLFGSGKMFLPQVVKSARVMKRAVSTLLPYIESQKITDSHSRASNSSGKIVLATVKGDIHDIGKNIVSVVLSCNNFEIIDLGVMVSAEKIIDTAVNAKADLIGLSGLITPSLEEMVGVVKELERRGLKIPVLIGGATTSKIHTAVKISPEYSGAVIHVSDASRAVTIARNLLGPNFNQLVANTKMEYKLLLESHLKRLFEKEILQIERARKNSFKTDWNRYTPPKPLKTGVAIVRVKVRDLIPYIDWTPFFRLWNLNGRYPGIFSDEKYGKEASLLYKDAMSLLENISAQIEADNLEGPSGIYGLFSANSCGDDIEVYSDTLNVKFITLRQQKIVKDGTANYALADFIAPKESGKEDFIGTFCVTAGNGIEQIAVSYAKAGDEFSSIMVKALGDRLAEAFAEYLHKLIRKEIWGYSQDENKSNEELIAANYRGIRPAPGYPACPDHLEKRTIWSLMDVESKIGVKLTENMAMYPASSVSGYYFSHIDSKYFGLGKIGTDQLVDYATRRGISISEAEKWLLNHIM